MKLVCKRLYQNWVVFFYSFSYRNFTKNQTVSFHNIIHVCSIRLCGFFPIILLIFVHVVGSINEWMRIKTKLCISHPAHHPHENSFRSGQEVRYEVEFSFLIHSYMSCDKILLNINMMKTRNNKETRRLNQKEGNEARANKIGANFLECNGAWAKWIIEFEFWLKSKEHFL